MRPYIIILSFISLIMQPLWSCKKVNAECDGKLVPTVTTNSPVVAGDSLRLSVSGISDVYMYNWYGPNGFSSHDSAPVLPGVNGSYAGRYSVDVITNGGCIYTTTTDSVLIGAPVLPCSLTNNAASIQGDQDLYFTYLTAGPTGGIFQLEANGAEGDAEIDFPGTGLPAAGIYTASNGPDLQPGQVQVSFTDYFGLWNIDAGTIYVSVTNKKITVSSCNLALTSDTYGFKTTGSFQLTQP
jgi:hypothetical protein